MPVLLLAPINPGQGGKHPCHIFPVFFQLPAQGSQVLKFRFFPDKRDKLDTHGTMIDIAGIIQYMGFNAQVVPVVYRWPVSDVEHGRITVRIQVYPYGINPVSGNQLVTACRLYIGSRKTQFPSDFESFRDRSLQAVIVSQEMIGLFYLSFRQQPSDGR